jgi:acetyl/propionyl-CoA carboxylase alpha subunit
MRIYLLEDELETKVNFTVGVQEVAFSIEVSRKIFPQKYCREKLLFAGWTSLELLCTKLWCANSARWKNKKNIFGFKPSGLSQNDPGSLVTQMPGKVVKVMAKVGDRVVKGQSLLILEAMKMENEVKAGKDGEVFEVHVKDGQAVDSGQVLISIT